MILQLLNPNNLAAVTYCISFTLITFPYNTRATQIVSPNAIKICQKPLRNAKLIAISRRCVGMDHTIFTSHIINASVLPPNQPQIAPKKSLITEELITVTKPVEIDTREPINILLNKSLPYLSVPK